MSMYSRPDKKRMNIQAERIYQFAGSTATWRQYVSGVSGVSEAGFGDTYYYRQQTITGQFGVMLNTPKVMENVAAPGEIAAGTFQIVTREKLGRRDEIVFNGSVHRVESDPVPATLVGWWVTQIKRASE